MKKQTLKQKLLCSILLVMFLLYLLPGNYYYNGQVLGFKLVTLYDRKGGVHEDVQVPEAGDVVYVPEEIEQSRATYESADRNWGSSTKQKYINNIWVEQGKTHSDDHWAYITIDGQERYMVALAPTYGLPGDYVDIYVSNNGAEVIYPCIIGDAKDIWVDEVYTLDGIVYGHDSGGKCNVVEIMSELSNDSSNWKFFEGTNLLNDLVGVTQIVNGGSIIDNPDGPVGLEGPYFSKISSTGSETETIAGAIGSSFRSFWVAIATWFENSVEDRNDVTVLYQFKISSTGTPTVSIGLDGFYQYYQDDYSHVSYGDSSIAQWGCGPTCFAMVASTIKNEMITPEDAVSWCENKYYVSRSWNLLVIF